MDSKEQSELPARPKEESGESAAPSKNALKKAAKDKEKAEKAAKRQQQEQEEKAKADANDTAKHLYGPLPSPAPPTPQKFCESLGEIANAKEDEEVAVHARVYNARVQSAKLAFLVLREQEHTIQVVIAEGGGQGISRQMVKWCGGINTESFVRVTGIVKKPKEEVKSASISHYELHIESIYMISEAAEMLPVQVKDCSKPPSAEEADENVQQADKDVNSGLKTRLDHRVLSLRPAANQAIFKLQSEITLLFIDYMRNHGFTLIQPSYLAGAATEGGSGVFQVTYFDRKAYLTQSPQFFKQMAIAGDMQHVFSIGPVFRAENSNTKRHLTEFTGLDFEMPIRNHYHEVLAFGEKLMIHIIRALQTDPKCQRLVQTVREAGYADAGTFLLPEGDDAVRITFAEAKTLLKESGYDIGADPHADIDTAQEKALGEIVRRKHRTDFFTVDQYPMSLRPFYTHPSTDSPSSSPETQLSNSYDFFMRGQEIMSGAQRIYTLPELRSNMKAKGVDPDAEGFRDYTNAFKYGCPPHGGGGLGLNRILQYFLGLNNIREATLFPRDPVRLGP